LAPTAALSEDILTCCTLAYQNEPVNWCLGLIERKFLLRTIVFLDSTRLALPPS